MVFSCGLWLKSSAFFDSAGLKDIGWWLKSFGNNAFSFVWFESHWRMQEAFAPWAAVI